MNEQPTRDELIRRVSAAVDAASYIALHAAAYLLERQEHEPSVDYAALREQRAKGAQSE